MKRWIRRALRELGFEIHRIRSSSPLQGALASAVFTQISVDTIFDVGANVGQSAADFLVRFPSAYIYCFEPFEPSVREIERRFPSDPRIRVIRQALADAAGTRQLHINESRDMNSLLPRSSHAHGYHLGGVTGETISVDVSTIDAFLEESPGLRINLLKIDVEGAELSCLRGAAQALAANAVDLIYLEVGFVPRFEGEALFWDIHSHLADYRYRLYDLFKLKRAPNGQLRIADALFVSAPVAERILPLVPSLSVDTERLSKE